MSSMLSPRVMQFLRKNSPHIIAELHGLRRRFGPLEKLQPGVADVHAPTALGNEGRRRRRDFMSALTDIRKPKDDEPAVAEGQAEKRFRAVVKCPECGVEKGQWHKDSCSAHVLGDVEGVPRSRMGKVWSSNAELPTSVQGLPDEAKTVFRRVANDRMKAGHSEVSSIKQAWTAVKNGWEKKGDQWVRKSEEAAWSIPLDVVKQDEDQQLVFGWASISEKDGKLIIDKQDDVILPEDLEKAAYDYVLYCREQGDMHERKGVGRLVESMVFTKQKQELLGIDLGLVGWWTGFHVTDKGVWKRIKAGELPEFSIGGKAIRVPI